MDENNLFAFVLMPFDKKFDDIYKFGVKEPAAQLGIIAERVDEQIYSEDILDRIYRQIDLADVVIADMTGQNPNVFYEVGYAHAKDKLCILLTSYADDIPFDLMHRRHIVYGQSIKTLEKRLIEELTWVRGEIEKVRRSRIKVKVKSVNGELKKSKFCAKGEVDFAIDLLNESNEPSAEIEAAYFYSTKGWKLYQEGRECPSTDSDLPDFSKRHFLNSPLRKLHKNSWGQLKFQSKKILAWATKGEELKDSYKVTGRSVLRLITSKGNVDYELPIEVSVDEFPFECPTIRSSRLATLVLCADFDCGLAQRWRGNGLNPARHFKIGGEIMKKFLAFGFLITSLCVMNYGCVKISTYTHERVDLETKGNKGYIVGNPPQCSSSTEKKDRKTLQFDITLPCVEKEDNISVETQKPQEENNISPAPQEEDASTILKPQQSEPEKSESTDDTIK